MPRGDAAAAFRKVRLEQIYASCALAKNPSMTAKSNDWAASVNPAIKPILSTVAGSRAESSKQNHNENGRAAATSSSALGAASEDTPDTSSPTRQNAIRHHARQWYQNIERSRTNGRCPEPEPTRDQPLYPTIQSVVAP